EIWSTSLDTNLRARGVGAAPRDTGFAVVGQIGLGDTQMRVMKFDAAGVEAWSDTVNTTGEFDRDSGNGVVIDTSGRVFVGGERGRKGHVWRYSASGVLEDEANVAAGSCSSPPRRSVVSGIAIGPLDGLLYMSGYEGECDDAYSTRRVTHVNDPDTQ